MAKLSLGDVSSNPIVPAPGSHEDLALEDLAPEDLALSVENSLAQC
jgi:hypothetical protein